MSSSFSPAEAVEPIVARARAGPSLGLVSATVLLAGLIVGPLGWHFIDVQLCWLHWAAATGGAHPGAIYQNTADFLYPCNYPPVVPYLLTGLQWLRLHVGAAARLRVAVELIKLPNLLAVVAGGWVVAAGLKPLAGRHAARAAAVRYLLCPVLFIDAAVWGQYEALMIVGMLAAVVLLMRDKPTWAGAALGAALGVKLQVFVIIPALVVYSWRRWGLLAVAKAAGAALVVVLLLAVPMILGGGGHGVWQSYGGAVDFYRQLTMGAGNVWEPLFCYRKYVLHWAPDTAASDVTPVLGRVSAKNLGLAMFAIYTLLLMIALWKRPDRHALALSAALTALGFFMLPTQIHERYIIPAVALLVLVTPVGYRRWYWLLVWASVPNLLTSIYATGVRASHLPDQNAARLHAVCCLISVLPNVLAMLGMTITLYRRAWEDDVRGGAAEQWDAPRISALTTA